VTASEFSFLALGLVLGLVGGAAIIEFARARPPAPREVRLTVAHDAVPRRSSTLADDAFTSAGAEPARGGPADRRLIGWPLPAGTSDRRTNVQFRVTLAADAAAAGGIQVGQGPGPSVPGRIMAPALVLPAAPPFVVVGRSVEMAGIAVSSGDDPVFGAIRSGAPATSTEVVAIHSQTETQTETEMVVASAAVGLLELPPTSDQQADPVALQRCAEERSVADERCELATRARARADAAADELRAAQRAYDAHEAAAVTASWHADPRAVHDAKETAQGGFRAVVAAADSAEALEAAAREWLTEINRINIEAREATATVQREHAAAATIGASLERLGLEADAARIGAENADAACLAARVVVAECDERAGADASTFLIPPPSVVPAGMVGLEEDETLGLALEAGGTPRIFRLLRGDRKAMTTLVASLADDAEGRRRWQLLMTGLVEAIVANAIEACALEFPEDHPFWSPFSRTQDRDIVHALASLGYHFDGLGGWTDEHVPSQRDLSLALGYAGLDPRRVRQWPTTAETEDLIRQVKVAADEYLAGIAGDLTLAEMVAMLGRRADGLAEVWNNWGRIRPLLLEER
jgi:hypothetical protein